MSTALSHDAFPPRLVTAHPIHVREFAGVSLPSRLLSESVRRTVRPAIDAWALAPALPWPATLVERLAFPLAQVPGTRRRAVRLPSCAAEYLSGPGVDPAVPGGPTILYLHGGAFLCCGLGTHRQMVSRISAATGAPVLNVGYRLLPGHPIRDSVEDGVAGLRWLLDQGRPIERIVLAGDSAGGFLAFAVALESLRLGLGRPAGIVALSPLTDLDPHGKLDHSNSRHCALFPRRAVPALTSLIDRVDAARGGGHAPVGSPVDADLTGMPPTLIQTGSHEMTFADAELMAQRLGAAGVPCELQIWERQVHVFQAASAVVPEGARAVAEIGAFVRTLD
ncbi:alpha/beta hydrolase [Rhodococcus phenolicus]|uniref:alpha/beta hydrolase n=1 Tax=Rhodococcus phenolicus TaxID=263849 RepID=UPI00083025DB|nr:alpha/beta hydrolase [Rhodococcus phenolicus]